MLIFHCSNIIVVAPWFRTASLAKLCEVLTLKASCCLSCFSLRYYGPYFYLFFFFFFLLLSYFDSVFYQYSFIYLQCWISSLLRRSARTKQPKHEVVVSYNFSSLKQREVVDSRDLPTYDPSECCTPSQNPSYWTRPSKKETRPGLCSDA